MSIEQYLRVLLFFFFKATAPTKIYTYCHPLSLPDALPISLGMAAIIITNKGMMPIMLTWVDIGDPVAFQEKQDKRDSVFDPVWRLVSNMVRPVPAVIAIMIAAVQIGRAHV